MDVLLDNAPFQIEPTSGQSLRIFLKHIQQEHCKPGQVIVGLRCDGMEIPAGAMAATLGRTASAIRRLEVVTGAPGSLVIEAITQASASLEALENEQRSAADRLSEGRIHEGVVAVAECVRSWQQLHEAVSNSLAMLGIDEAGFRVNGESLTQTLQRPKELFVQVREALLARDYVLLADLLQYEFGDAAASWRSLFDAVIREARRRHEVRDSA